jgi:hypothetical protein
MPMTFFLVRQYMLTWAAESVNFADFHKKTPAAR